MLRLDPTVIRITLSEVKQYERQRKAQDRSGRGNNTLPSLQSFTSSLTHLSPQLRFLPDNVLSDQESTEIYNSPTAVDHDDGDYDTVVEDSEKMDTSSSDNEDEGEGDENESMRDTYEGRLQGLDTPRLSLPLPFSATARVTTATNHPGTVCCRSWVSHHLAVTLTLATGQIIRLPRGLQHSEPRRTAYLAPETLSTRAAAVISRQNDLSTRVTLRQAPLHDNDAMNTWQPHALGDLTEAQQHERLQPPFLPSIPSPSPRSPRHGERTHIPTGGFAHEVIRQLGVTVGSEGTGEQGMTVQRLAAPAQDGRDEVNNPGD